MASSPTASPHELVLRRIAHGARLVGLGWWALLSVLVAVDSGSNDQAWVPWLTTGLAVVWAIVTSSAYRVDPFTSTWRPIVLFDVVLATFAFLAVAWSGSGTLFYGGFPLIVVFVAAIRGRRSAWLAATVLAVVAGVQLFSDRQSLVFPISQILVYPVGAAIGTWTVGILRRSQSTLAEAQATAARAEEREEISRHLHDSVLQTLALVQRSADRPDEVVGLARRQERELRNWLYGPAVDDRSTLDDRLRSAAAEVEDRYRVAVEVVTVGEPGDQLPIGELVAAAREAMVNAAKHASVDQVAVFGEADADRAVVFVRDRGVGFQLGDVAGDRRGIRESIMARMARINGTATLRSDDGRTEWRLEVARKNSGRPPIRRVDDDRR